MSERVGRTRSGQKNRLVAMNITAIKQDRSTRPDTTGTGTAQRMTAWGIPAEAGGEEDGFANAVPGKRNAQRATLHGTSGHLFGAGVGLARAVGGTRTAQESPVIELVGAQFFARHRAGRGLFDVGAAVGRHAANAAHPLVHGGGRNGQAGCQAGLSTHRIAGALNRGNRFHG